MIKLAMKMATKLLAVCAVLLGSQISFGETKEVRWTESQETSSDFSILLKRLNQETGFKLTESDFKLVEQTRLSTSQFQMWQQVIRDIPIGGKSIRLWKDPTSQRLIQLEARLQDPAQQLPLPLMMSLLQKRSLMSTNDLLTQVRKNVGASEDSAIKKISRVEQWVSGDLQQVFVVKARHGEHRFVWSMKHQAWIEQGYRQYPQQDLAQPAVLSQPADVIEIPAKAFPIWEEDGSGAAPVQTEPVLLKNLYKFVKRSNVDPFAELRKRRFFQDLLDPVKGMDPAYQMQGFWSFPYLKSLAQEAIQKIPDVNNDFHGGGLSMLGVYASVNIAPDAIEHFKGIQIPLIPSPNYSLEWGASPENQSKSEILIKTPFLGRVFNSQQELDQLEAKRDPQHDPTFYINNGFDQIQVYYAINQLFESLWQMGFKDPELSTRRFDAYLYIPDVGAMNNAFYDSDTINFTTYSPQAQNFARDNTTIWHELGHGVMDRLMGSQLNLSGAGGLSEGMADFIAQLVIEKVTHQKDFAGKSLLRIFNDTGFNLTNEEHDDGEAYGGAMNEILMAAIQQYGEAGVAKVADLVLEAMRLSRNHPFLTVKDWFEHVYYADERGSELRGRGELRSMIQASLESRNFSLNGGDPAVMSLKLDDTEIEDGSRGTRYSPVGVELPKDGGRYFRAQVQLKDSQYYRFPFPVKVQMQFEGGPLQGAIHWKGEENGVQTVVLNSEKDLAEFGVEVTGKCDSINTSSQACKDFLYFKVVAPGKQERVLAKKRFYVRLTQLGK